VGRLKLREGKRRKFLRSLVHDSKKKKGSWEGGRVRRWVLVGTSLYMLEPFGTLKKGVVLKRD